MSDKLFEYKDPQDWYIAQWGERSVNVEHVNL